MHERYLKHLVNFTTILSTNQPVVLGVNASSGRHLASGSERPGFEYWLCQVDVASLGKALFMHFLTPLMCKKSAWL